MANAKCDECSSYTLQITPENLRFIKLQKGEYDSRRKPAGKSIEGTLNEMIRELRLLKKSEPLVIVKAGDFHLVREIDHVERLHVINAMNKKMKT